MEYTAHRQVNGQRIIVGTFNSGPQGTARFCQDYLLFCKALGLNRLVVVPVKEKADPTGEVYQACMDDKVLATVRASSVEDAREKLSTKLDRTGSLAELVTWQMAGRKVSVVGDSHQAIIGPGNQREPRYPLTNDAETNF